MLSSKSLYSEYALGDEEIDSIDAINSDIFRYIRKLEKMQAYNAVKLVVDAFIRIAQHFSLNPSEYEYYLDKYQDTPSGDLLVSKTTLIHEMVNVVERLEKITDQQFDVSSLTLYQMNQSGYKGADVGDDSQKGAAEISHDVAFNESQVMTPHESTQVPSHKSPSPNDLELSSPAVSNRSLTTEEDELRVKLTHYPELQEILEESLTPLSDATSDLPESSKPFIPPLNTHPVKNGDANALQLASSQNPADDGDHLFLSVNALKHYKFPSLPPKIEYKHSFH